MYVTSISVPLLYNVTAL